MNDGHRVAFGAGAAVDATVDIPPLLLSSYSILYSPSGNLTQGPKRRS